MKAFLYVLSLCFTVSLTSCIYEADEPRDRLLDSGLLGEWKLDSREVNNIDDLSVQCCDYLTFSEFGSPNDLRGSYKARGTGYENEGEFECNETLDSIQFIRENVVTSYGLVISNQSIVLNYVENGDSISELWVKHP